MIFGKYNYFDLQLQHFMYYLAAVLNFLTGNK